MAVVRRDVGLLRRDDIRFSLAASRRRTEAATRPVLLWSLEIVQLVVQPVQVVKQAPRAARWAKDAERRRVRLLLRCNILRLLRRRKGR